MYPKIDKSPDGFGADEEKADYVRCICAAWDTLIYPEPETFDRFRGWKDIFDKFPLRTSLGYHAFRAHFGWEAIPSGVPGFPLGWEISDRLEGRGPDPCEGMI